VNLALHSSKDVIPALTSRRGAKRSAEMVEVEVKRNGIASGNHVNGGGAEAKSSTEKSNGESRR